MSWIEHVRAQATGLATRLHRRTLVGVTAALVAFSALAQALPGLPPPAAPLRVATFDSGFGGYLTAKSIEGSAAQLLRDYDTAITIRHYGDTANLPYGEKTPGQIATLGSAGVLRAFEQGADMVFIACNTASTQFAAIRKAVDGAYPGKEKPVVSIIDASASEAKRLLDLRLAQRPTATFVIMATPATVRAMVYPRQLATLYGATLKEGAPKVFTQARWYRAKGATLDSLVQKNEIDLPGGQHIDVVQFAPANWVELIEHGADPALKQAAVKRDLGLLAKELGKGTQPDVVGYFCTHYPIFDANIRTEVAAQLPGPRETSYIAQGALMARIFQGMAEARLKGHLRTAPLAPEQLRTLVTAARANITISGQNGPVTRQLAATMFPNDPAPVVTEEDLGRLTPAGAVAPK